MKSVVKTGRFRDPTNGDLEVGVGDYSNGLSISLLGSRRSPYDTYYGLWYDVEIHDRVDARGISSDNTVYSIHGFC